MRGNGFLRRVGNTCWSRLVPPTGGQPQNNSFSTSSLVACPFSLVPFPFFHVCPPAGRARRRRRLWTLFSFRKAPEPTTFPESIAAKCSFGAGKWNESWTKAQSAALPLPDGETAASPAAPDGFLRLKRQKLGGCNAVCSSPKTGGRQQCGRSAIEGGIKSRNTPPTPTA